MFKFTITLAILAAAAAAQDLNAILSASIKTIED